MPTLALATLCVRCGGMVGHFFGVKTPPAETDQDTKLDIFESSPMIFSDELPNLVGPMFFLVFPGGFFFFGTVKVDGQKVAASYRLSIFLQELLCCDPFSCLVGYFHTSLRQP